MLKEGVAGSCELPVWVQGTGLGSPDTMYLSGSRFVDDSLRRQRQAEERTRRITSLRQEETAGGLGSELALV